MFVVVVMRRWRRFRVVVFGVRLGRVGGRGGTSIGVRRFRRSVSSVDSVVFVVDLSDARPLRSFAKATSPGWGFASFVDAVFVSGDYGSAHGDGESRALRANIEWL